MNYLKKHLFVMIALATLTNVSYAQVSTETLDAEVDAQIDQMYPQGSGNSATRGQVINQNVVVSKAVQKQPVTVIEASPLSNSNADAIRKNRQEEELRTETRIVEKLEISRMEDEKRRAQVLFGDKFDSLNNRAEVAPVAAPVQQTIVAPSSNIQAQPIVIEEKEKIDRDTVQEEVRAALEAEKAAAAQAEEGDSLFERKYIMATTGMPMYAENTGIKGEYSIGLGIGTSNDYLEFEGGFVFSNYKIEDAAYALPYNTYNNVYQNYYSTCYSNNGVPCGNFKMSQYQTYLSTKFIIMNGAVRPNVGALVSYSYRTYVADSYTYYGGPGTDFGKSSAIDLGITAGVDVALNRRFSLGADMKYMFNMSANLDGETVGAKSPEKLNHYTLGIVAKMGF